MELVFFLKAVAYVALSIELNGKFYNRLHLSCELQGLSEEQTIN